VEASSPTNGTVDVATPSSDAQPPDDNIALIGGIVGGVVALLLIGGLVACLVARHRRSVKHDATALPPAASKSNYGRTPTTQKQPTYDDVDAVRQRTNPNYDDVDAVRKI
jgi:hypothetical protein